MNKGEESKPFIVLVLDFIVFSLSLLLHVNCLSIVCSTNWTIKRSRRTLHWTPLCPRINSQTLSKLSDLRVMHDSWISTDFPLVIGFRLLMKWVTHLFSNHCENKNVVTCAFELNMRNNELDVLCCIVSSLKQKFSVIIKVHTSFRSFNEKWLIKNVITVMDKKLFKLMIAQKKRKMYASSKPCNVRSRKGSWGALLLQLLNNRKITAENTTPQYKFDQFQWLCSLWSYGVFVSVELLCQTLNWLRTL